MGRKRHQFVVTETPGARLGQLPAHLEERSQPHLSEHHQIAYVFDGHTSKALAKPYARLTEGLRGVFGPESFIVPPSSLALPLIGGDLIDELASKLDAPTERAAAALLQWTLETRGRPYNSFLFAGMSGQVRSVSTFVPGPDEAMLQITGVGPALYDKAIHRMHRDLRDRIGQALRPLGALEHSSIVLPLVYTTGAVSEESIAELASPIRETFRQAGRLVLGSPQVVAMPIFSSSGPNGPVGGVA